MSKVNEEKRVYICEFIQESNSFNPVLTDWEDFQGSGIFEGQQLVDAGEKAGQTVDGMVHGVLDRGYTPVGGIRMRSKSGGPVKSAVVDRFLTRALDGLQNAGALEGILLSLHGATLSDTSDDVCGDIIQRVRQAVGPKVVIAVSFDLHANVTSKIMENADFVCGYQTYPHLDFFQVGYRAAMLMADQAEGKRLVTVCAAIPMMAPAHGYTTRRGRLALLMQQGKDMEEAGRIRDYSVFQVQPWLDIPEIASTIVVTADTEEAACTAAKELAAEEFSLRHTLLGRPLCSVEEVIHLALENGEDKPVILVDSADSPNAGASGDIALVIEKLLPYRNVLRAAVSVNDVAAVEKAFRIGVGGCADFMLGATLAPELSRPVLVDRAEVKSLHNGGVLLGGPAERAQYRDVGHSAVLQVGELQILVTSHGENEGDLQFYRGFGIEPTLCRLVCVKACSSFRAGYEKLSAKICNTATSGAADPILKNLPFCRLPKPFYPFQSIGRADIGEPRRFREEK